MKLAYICTESLPSPALRGGAIQMMIDGVTPFLKENYQITVYSVSDPDLPDYEIVDDIEYIRFPSAHYENGVATNLTMQQFEIIHVFNRPKNIPLYKAAAPNSKFVLGIHNEMFSERKISSYLGQKVIFSVDKIVTISNYIKQTIIERFPEATSKIKIVYSGVNLQEYPPIWTNRGKEIRNIYRKKYCLDGEKVIFFSGRLTKNKGTHLLIKAMRALVTNHPNVVLVISGGKWFSNNDVNQYVRYLYRLAKPLGNKIIFTKFIPAHKIANLFLMSDIFVCSSQWQEPLARVNYEAMAASLPVITTNRGGNSEVMIHLYNGYLLEEYNQISSYVKAINYYLNHPEMASWIARNGRAFVEANFQFHHVASRLETVYEEILEPSKN